VSCQLHAAHAAGPALRPTRASWQRIAAVGSLARVAQESSGVARGSGAAGSLSKTPTRWRRQCSLAASEERRPRAPQWISESISGRCRAHSGIWGCALVRVTVASIHDCRRSCTANSAQHQSSTVCCQDSLSPVLSTPLIIASSSTVLQHAPARSKPGSKRCFKLLVQTARRIELSGL
jgi:hypothetical protein